MKLSVIADNRRRASVSAVFVVILAAGMVGIVVPPASAADTGCGGINGHIASDFVVVDQFEFITECTENFVTDFDESGNIAFTASDGTETTAASAMQYRLIPSPPEEGSRIVFADVVGDLSTSLRKGDGESHDDGADAGASVRVDFEIPEGATGSVFASVSGRTTGRLSQTVVRAFVGGREARVDLLFESPGSGSDSIAVNDLGPGAHSLNMQAFVIASGAHPGQAGTATGHFDVTVMVGESACENEFTTGADNIVGTPGNDILCGGDGNDSIDGGSGNDTIFGGEGGDFLFGEPGDDILDGGNGDDSFDGGAGNDSIRGGEGSDILIGDLGDDDLDGGTGDDIRLYGGPGDDDIDGGAGNDGRGQNFSEVIAGGAGNDNIFGGAGDDKIFGACGQDIVGDIACLPFSVPAPGDADRDHILGEAGQDVILGDGDSDFVDAGAAKDQIFGGDGNDIITGGPGDEVNISDDFPATSGIDGGAGKDFILGGTGDDLIEGDDGKDEIKGEQGSDKLRGQDGADCLIGGPRKDVLVGGPDGDRLIARDGVHDVVNGGPQFDRARVDGVDDLIRIENDNFQGGCP